jgi:hypothetical protein
MTASWPPSRFQRQRIGMCRECVARLPPHPYLCEHRPSWDAPARRNIPHMRPSHTAYHGRTVGHDIDPRAPVRQRVHRLALPAPHEAPERTDRLLGRSSRLAPERGRPVHGLALAGRAEPDRRLEPVDHPRHAQGQRLPHGLTRWTPVTTVSASARRPLRSPGVGARQRLGPWRPVMTA